MQYMFCPSSKGFLNFFLLPPDKHEMCMVYGVSFAMGVATHEFVNFMK